MLLLWGQVGFSQEADTTAVAKTIQYDDADVTPVSFNEETLNDYKKDSAFDYKEYEAPDNWWTRFQNWLSELWNSFIQWILGGAEATGILKIFLEALPYLIIFGVLCLIVYLFIKSDLAGSPMLGRTPGQVILSDEQNIIETQNIQQLIDAALKDGNYRLAIRFYYLLLLQKLTKKDIIDWQVQKTNAEYVFEIKDEQLRVQFSRLTRIYDFIWYGNFEVDEDAFAKAQQEFIKVNQAL